MIDSSLYYKVKYFESHQKQFKDIFFHLFEKGLHRIINHTN